MMICPLAPPHRLIRALCVLALVAPSLWGCGQAPVAQASGGAQNGQCVPNQCQISGSLQADGSCAYTNKADGTGCDDNNSCTLFDTCKKGVCTAGTILKDGATCDDKNVCTQTDICQKGVCVGTNPLICPAGDACHQSLECHPVQGCVLKSYGPCVEGLAALKVDGCVSSAFFAPMTLGGKPFSLLVDSGSSTTAVASAQCPNCLVSPTYTPTESASANRTAKGSYADQTGWEGKIYLESAMAGNNGTPLSPAINMRLAAITKDADPNNPFFTGSTCGPTYDANAYQGILGLGPTDLLLPYTDSFMDQLGFMGMPIYDAFAVNLCDVGGQMWFGGFNPAAMAQAPNYTPMVTRNPEGTYYAVAIDDLIIGSTSVGLASEALGPAIIDTGTGAYGMSQEAYDATTALITADANFLAHFPKSFFKDDLCVASNLGASPAAIDAALPTLTLAMPSGGVLGGMQVNMAATQSYLQPQSDGSTVRYCSTLAKTGTTIFGSAFMRSQVLIFDRENGQVGFAPQTTCNAKLPYNLVNPRKPSGM